MARGRLRSQQLVRFAKAASKPTNSNSNSNKSGKTKNTNTKADNGGSTKSSDTKKTGSSFNKNRGGKNAESDGSGDLSDSMGTPQATNQFAELAAYKPPIAKHFESLRRTTDSPTTIELPTTAATVANSLHYYVDKTKFIYENLFMNNRSKYFLVTRPPQFGKSLICSTIASLCSGAESSSLFRGLWIESNTEWDFQMNRCPIIYLDMMKIVNGISEPQQFGQLLVKEMLAIAKEHNFSIAIDHNRNSNSEDYISLFVKKDSNEMQQKKSEQTNNTTVMDGMYIHKVLRALMNGLCERYENKRPIVMIDNYEFPLNAFNKQPKEILQMEGILREFYGGIRSHEDIYRFVYITGSLSFDKESSIFKSFNNLLNLSFKESIAEMLGYSTNEVIRLFGKVFHGKLNSKGNNNENELKEIADILQTKYGGYKFGVDRNTGELSDPMMNPSLVDRVIYSLARAVKAKDSSSGAQEPLDLKSILSTIELFPVQPITSVLGCPTCSNPTIVDLVQERQQIAPLLATNLTTLIDSAEPLFLPLHKILYDIGYLTMKGIELHKNNRLHKAYLDIPNDSVLKTMRELSERKDL